MNTQIVKSDLNELLYDSQFLSLADTYLPMIDQNGTIPYQAYFEKKINNINQAEFLVPVLGIQGTGKSSMLNALLMDDLILPVDADETTCIPVEIRYGKENDGEIKVYFTNRNHTIIKDNKELEQYVHNKYNEGNEKGVSHIVVYKDNDLLANNLVLVDLPGVGSLTLQNVKVTMDYVERLSAAIFILRTVPTITKHEEIFLTNVWPKLTQAWFVQNQWNDESTAEVEDGRSYNEDILKKIALKHQSSETIQIKVINVYKALNAKLENDEQAYKDSGLQEFRTFLYEISKNWGPILEGQFTESIRFLIQEIKDKIEQRIEEAQMTADELRTKQLKEEQKYEQIYQSNKKKISDMQDRISAEKTKFYDFASVESKRQMENLRNEMRRVIGSGITDGHLLNKAYQDIEAEIAEETMDKLSLMIFQFQKELTLDLAELEIKDSKGKFQKTGSFNRREQFKGEKALPYICSIGGGIAGFATGTATVAKVGALIGSVGGPVGAAVGIVAGAIVGVGITFVAGWLGAKTKKKVTEIRQTYTVKDLENPLRSFRDNLKETIEGVSEKGFENIEQALMSFKQLQKKSIDDEKERHLSQFMNHGVDVQGKFTTLKLDLQKILNYEEALNGKLDQPERQDAIN